MIWKIFLPEEIQNFWNEMFHFVKCIKFNVLFMRWKFNMLLEQVSYVQASALLHLLVILDVLGFVIDIPNSMDSCICLFMCWL